MKFRARFDLVGTTLLAALGAGHLGCGGSAFHEAGAGAAGGSDGVGGGSSTGSGGFATGGSGAGGSPGSNAFPCLNPTPVVDQTSGYVACSTGYVHRTHQAECPNALPRPEPVQNYDPMIDQCQYDSDCADGPNGFCSLPRMSFGGPAEGVYHCQYGCLNDAECPSGSICVCGDPVGQCISATCTSDADCAPGFNCASYEANPGCPFLAFACQTPADSCGGDADCGENMFCSVSGEGRSCAGHSCVIGRPFLVHDAARVAPAIARGDWLAAGVEPRVTALSAGLRRTLAGEWTRAGQMEHASVAAFARFTLQLLSLGAPPWLIELSTRAMADETEHAKLCFALASRYGSAAVGPGALAIDGSLDDSTLPAIVATAIREGCIGETVAALEAAEAAEHAKDPAIRAALLRIGADEARHAELAWRFVQWALAQGSAGVASVVAAEFEAVPGEEPAPSADPTAEEPAQLEHGVLPPRVRSALRRRALARVVGPCSRALGALGPASAVDRPGATASVA